MLESGTLVSGVLGTAFKLVIKPPTLATEAPTTPLDIPTILMAKAPNMVRTLTAAENTIEEALRQLATDTNVSYPAPPDIAHGAGL
eukprot:3894208-Ditylum_brightwellii.AAC.1